MEYVGRSMQKEAAAAVKEEKAVPAQLSCKRPGVIHLGNDCTITLCAMA